MGLPVYKRLVACSEIATPTLDYYFPHSADSIRLVGDQVLDFEPVPGDWVVIVRSVSLPIWNHLLSFRPRLSGLAWFIDDDLSAGITDLSLPLRYRMRNWALRRKVERHILPHVAQVWVANQRLTRCYPDAVLWSPTGLPATPPMRVIFYHGSASHGREILFLRRVIEALQRQRQDTVFELFGGTRTRKLFRGIPRVRVIHPVPWPDYLAITAPGDYTIGLAPLLAGPFNEARTWTKFLEITRLGAAGIYSDHPAFREGPIVDRENGFLLKDDPATWVSRILELLDDPVLMIHVVARARESVAGLKCN